MFFKAVMKERLALALFLWSFHQSKALILNHVTHDRTGFRRSYKKTTSRSRRLISTDDSVSRLLLWSVPHETHSNTVASLTSKGVAADEAFVTDADAGIEVTKHHADTTSENMVRLEAQKLELELELLTTRHQLTASRAAQAKLNQSAEAAAARFANRESLLTLELETARIELGQSQVKHARVPSDASEDNALAESKLKAPSKVEELQEQLRELQQDRDKLQSRTELLALELQQARLEIDVVQKKADATDALKQRVDESESARDQAMARVNLLAALLQQKTALLEVTQGALDEERETDDKHSSVSDNVAAIQAELSEAHQKIAAAEAARASAAQEAGRWKKRGDLALLSLQVRYCLYTIITQRIL